MTAWGSESIRVVTLADTAGRFEGFVCDPVTDLAPELPTIRRTTVAIDFCCPSPLLVHVLSHGGWIDRRGRLHPRSLPVALKPYHRAMGRRR